MAGLSADFYLAGICIWPLGFSRLGFYIVHRRFTDQNQDKLTKIKNSTGNITADHATY